MKLTKVTSAVRHIEAAIAAMEAGHYDIAITLAGAAEECLPETEISMFRRLIRVGKERGLDGETPLAVQLNATRNWLKHRSGPPAIEVLEAEGLFMIARAMTHLPPDGWSDAIEAYKPTLLAKLKKV